MFGTHWWWFLSQVVQWVQSVLASAREEPSADRKICSPIDGTTRGGTLFQQQQTPSKRELRQRVNTRAHSKAKRSRTGMESPMRLDTQRRSSATSTRSKSIGFNPKVVHAERMKALPEEVHLHILYNLYIISIFSIIFTVQRNLDLDSVYFYQTEYIFYSSTTLE